MGVSDRTENEIVVGQRLELWGGYDYAPKWLGGKDFLVGTVERFIPGQNKEAAMLVRLDSAISVDGVTGNIVVLELRYVELCDFEPESESWKERRQGAWVESHASFKPR